MSEDERPVPPDGYEHIELDGSPNLSEAELAWLDEEPEEYEWVTKMDREILELLLTSGIVLTPAVIADNLNRSRSGISRRLNSLQAGGLVNKEGRGKYSISKLGAGYVIAGPSPTE